MRSVKIIHPLFIVIILLAISSSPLHSQVNSEIDKTISIKLDSVNLAIALDRIGESAGIEFRYDSEQFKGIRVFGEFQNISVNTILSYILSDHSINYIINDDGSILVKKQRFAGLGNSIISGRVVKKGSNEPLVNANVYLNQTLIGAATDKDGLYAINNVPLGSYILIVSYSGYNPIMKQMEINSNDFIKLDIELEENIELQSEIMVIAENPKLKDRNLEQFQKAFIGDSKNAGKTDIININTLTLNFNQKEKTLTARAAEPLIIENYALGYRIVFNLLDFKMIDKDVEFKGYSFFEKMDTDDQSLKKEWIENREKAYLGSLPHFLRSLINDKVKRNRYELHYGSTLVTFRNAPGHLKDYTAYELDKKIHPERYTLTRQLAKPFENYSEIWVESAGDNGFVLKYDELLEVSYRNDKNRSILRLNNGSAFFNHKGQLRDPYSVTVTGEWARRKIAEMLPYEYNPEVDALLNFEVLDDDKLAEKYSTIEDFGGDGELISTVLQFWLERYKKISRNNKAEPLTGIEFIELVTRYKIMELYDVASQLYFWGFSGGFNDDNFEIVEAEINRIIALLGENEKAEWKDLLNKKDDSLFIRFREFWKKRDPVPVSIANERLLEHWERINYAKSRYTRNKNSVYGTDDRGTVYVRYGRPDKIARDSFGANIDYLVRYRRYIEDVKRHKYNYNPDFELWIYTDLLNKDTVRYFFGPEYGKGEYGLRTGVEEFIDPNAFLDSGTLLTAPITVGTILQYAYYKQLEEVDDMYYFRNLELIGARALSAAPSVSSSTIMREVSKATSSVTTKNISLHTSEKSISRFVYSAYDRNDPAKVKAEKEASDYGDILRSLNTRFFLYRLLGSDNNPKLGLAVYNLPIEYSGESVEYVYDLSGKNNYNLINSIIVTDDKWNEIDRIIDVPSTRKSNFSLFEFSHRNEFYRYELASVASEIFLQNSLSNQAFVDTLFGSIAGYKSYIATGVPLETDIDSLVISDILIGKELSDLPDGDFFKVYPVDKFTHGQNMLLYFELYHLFLNSSGKGKYTVKYRIQSNDSGNILRRLTGRRGNNQISEQEYKLESIERSSGELLELDISALEQGNYTLTIEVQDNTSKQIRIRSVTFEITGSD